MLEYHDQLNRILKDYSMKLSSRLEHGTDFRVFYKNGGDTINVLTLVSRDDDPVLLKEIYDTEAKILRRYVLHEKNSDIKGINFRVIPKYNSSLADIVPSGFKRFNAKFEITSI